MSSNNVICAKIKSVAAVEGEVDLNVRKGKILYFYDLRIILHWRAELLDKSIKASGTITIPEFSPEIIRASDLVFQTTYGEDSCQDPIFRANLASVLRDPLFAALTDFLKELESVHGASLLVVPPVDKVLSQEKQQLATAIQQEKSIISNPKSSDSKQVNQQSSSIQPSSTIQTTTLRQNVSFAAPPDLLYDILKNPEKIAIWARGPPSQHGDYFRLFDGNVECRFIETSCVSNERLVMDWRFQSWPSSIGYSRVTIKLKPDHSLLNLELEQHGIPFADLARLENNWREYYWKPIKSIFGLGTDF
jgi:activator of HSP90 ATPase